MTSGLLRRTTYLFDGDDAGHRNHQDQSPAEKLKSPDRQPCHGSEA
jgi:hypothetical protein